jgi:hypothetical protein
MYTSFAQFATASMLGKPDAPPDGLSLTPYTGADATRMTVGSELNKLASNIARGRNIAGVHWHSDAVQAILLGEQVAISILQDWRIQQFHVPRL